MAHRMVSIDRAHPPVDDQKVRDVSGGRATAYARAKTEKALQSGFQMHPPPVDPAELIVAVASWRSEQS